MKLAMTVIAVLLVGCTPSGSTATAAGVTAFEAEQINCIEQADARAAADKCRASALASFCAEYPALCDGGAP